MNQSLATAPDGRAAAAPDSRAPTLRGYWPHSAVLAILLTAVVGARAHELIPVLPKIRPALLMAVVGGLLAISSTAPAVRQRALREPLFTLPAAYFAWAALTAPLALWVGLAVKGLQGVLPALILCFVILLCEPTLRTVDRLQRGFVLGCAVTAVLAQFRGYSVDGRLTTGASLDSNDLAAVVALVTPLCAGLLTRARGAGGRLLWGGVLAALVGTLVMTGSRGGVIAIAVSTAIYVAGQPGRRRALFALAAVLTAATAWNFGSVTFRERMTSFFIEGEEDYNYTDWTGRRAVWKRARGYVLASPVIGVGFQNFPVAEGETCKRLFPGRGCKWSNTHNAYLQAASELGLPGLAMFVAMLVAGARRALPLWRPTAARRGGRPHRPEFLAAMGGFAAAAYFLSHAYFFLMFALLALIGLASVAAARSTADARAAAARPAAEPASAPPARRGMRGGGSFAPGFRGGLARLRAGVD